MFHIVRRKRKACKLSRVHYKKFCTLSHPVRTASKLSSWHTTMSTKTTLSKFEQALCWKVPGLVFNVPVKTDRDVHKEFCYEFNPKTSNHAQFASLDHNSALSPGAGPGPLPKNCPESPDPVSKHCAERPARWQRLRSPQRG